MGIVRTSAYCAVRTHQPAPAARTEDEHVHACRRR